MEGLLLSLVYSYIYGVQKWNLLWRFSNIKDSLANIENHFLMLKIERQFLVSEIKKKCLTLDIRK